jgi:hypothetical protein
MAQAGFTPIQLYFSSTAAAVPTSGNLIAGELALNTNDGKLYYKSSAGVVRTLADSSTATGNLPGGTTGALVYQSAPSTTTYLTIGGAGSIVYSNGTIPAYSATGAAGSLLYSTGSAPAYASIGAVGSLVYSNGTTPTSLPIGTIDTVLTSTGTIPQFVSQASLSVGTAAVAGFATTAGAASTATTATTSTNLAGGVANQIVYQTGAGTTAFAVAPTGADVGKVLSWSGTLFTWASAPAATTASNIAGGAQYQIPFQSGIGATTFNANLTFNSSTNTFETTNVTATGAVAGNTVAATAGVSAGTTVAAGTAVTAGTSVTATTSVTGATVIANKAIAPTATTGAYSYGTLGYTDTNIFASYQTSVNSYAQKILQNTSSGSSASADYIVSNNLGTATTYYGDFGINSSTYSGIGPFQLPNAVYLYSTNSDLVVGTKTAHELRLVTNDNSADSVTISPTSAVAFNGNYGVAGQVLQSNGTASAPTWINTSTLGTSKGFVYFCGQF